MDTNSALPQSSQPAIPPEVAEPKVRAPFKRYYDDNCNTDPRAPVKQLTVQLHALYTHWVRANYQAHDFAEAVEHTAAMLFIDYLMSGKPDLVGERLEVQVVELALPRKRADGLPLRFYDETSALDPRVDDSRIRPALAGLFVNWVADGWHPRDFQQAAKDGAAVVRYDHDLCCSFGGMGGGKTGEEFLTQPYKD